MKEGEGLTEEKKKNETTSGQSDSCIPVGNSWRRREDSHFQHALQHLYHNSVALTSAVR